MTNKETEFPDCYTLVLDYNNIYQYDRLDKKEVLDWFKRCIDDYPHLDKYDVKGDAFPANIIHDRTRWFNKWFSQFRKDLNITSE